MGTGAQARIARSRSTSLNAECGAADMMSNLISDTGSAFSDVLIGSQAANNGRKMKFARTAQTSRTAKSSRKWASISRLSAFVFFGGKAFRSIRSCSSIAWFTAEAVRSGKQSILDRGAVLDANFAAEHRAPVLHNIR
jgi:hypothetical protein